jgi:hypothetical protein
MDSAIAKDELNKRGVVLSEDIFFKYLKAGHVELVALLQGQMIVFPAVSRIQ